MLHRSIRCTGGNILTYSAMPVGAPVLQKYLKQLTELLQSDGAWCASRPAARRQ
jgi:hypothetical protein